MPFKNFSNLSYMSVSYQEFALYAETKFKFFDSCTSNRVVWRTFWNKISDVTIETF